MNELIRKHQILHDGEYAKSNAVREYEWNQRYKAATGRWPIMSEQRTNNQFLRLVAHPSTPLSNGRRVATYD